MKMVTKRRIESAVKKWDVKTLVQTISETAERVADHKRENWEETYWTERLVIYRKELSTRS